MAMATKLRGNERFQKRVLNRFDQADKNKDGVLTMSEVLQYAETLKKLTGTTDEEIQPLRDVLREFYGGLGVTEQGVRRENWVENCANFVATDLQRIEAGETSILKRLFETFFGLVDLNNDKTLSLEEFAIFCKCFEYPEDITKVFFDFADTNKNGKLELDEFCNVFFNFWYKSEEGDIEKAFGGHF